MADEVPTIFANRRIAWKIAHKYAPGAAIPLDAWGELVAICKHYLETTDAPFADGRPAAKKAAAKKKSATK